MSARPGALRGFSEQVRSAWMSSPLPRFLAWWKDELLGLLPGTLRVRWLRGATPCLLAFEGATLVLRVPEPDQRTSVTPFLTPRVDEDCDAEQAPSPGHEDDG